ncbi:MAG: hypothetical protein AB8H80_17855 [Planctomycetota bacterium]
MSCQSDRPHRLRSALQREATWLAEAYDAQAEAGEKILGTANRQAAAKCNAIADLTAQMPNDLLQKGASLAEMRCRLQEVREQVAGVRRDVAKRDEVIAALQAAIDKPPGKAEPTPQQRTGQASQSANGSAQLPKAHAARLAKLLSALQKLREVTTHAGLAIPIARAEQLLSSNEQDKPDDRARRQGALSVQVENTTRTLNGLLETERKKDANSRNVKALGAALGDLKRAKAIVAEKATPSSYKLAQAEAILASAGKVASSVRGGVELLPSPWFRAHAGVIQRGSYAMVPGTNGEAFRLQNNDGGTGSYFEIDFLHRRAWLPPAEQYQAADASLPNTDLDMLIPDDFEARLRFTSGDSIEDAESAAGGDWNIEAATGWNLTSFQLKTEDACERNPERKKLAQGTVNLELLGGVSTDSATLNGHGYIAAGLGSAWSFPMEIKTSVYRSATIYAGVFYGLYDSPQLDEGDVQFINSSRPVFNSIGTLGIRFDAQIPLTKTIDGIIGARYWDPLGRDDLPESWSVFLGVSIPVGRILKATVGATDAP